MKEDKTVVEGTTCFAEHAKRKLPCLRTSCRNWINDTGCSNCSLVSAQEGPKTLEEIGNVFGLTRMRICQIEKVISRKFAEIIQQN
jgi:hypothetical protein